MEDVKNYLKDDPFDKVHVWNLPPKLLEIGPSEALNCEMHSNLASN